MGTINKERPKIVYIIGDVRSGSTLLESLLSLHSGTTTVGELHRLSDFYYEKSLQGKTWNYQCSCGEKVNKCSYWTSLVSSESKNDIKFETQLKFFVNRSILPFKYIMKRFVKRKLFDKKIHEKGANVAETCWDLYGKISNETSSNLIIDSSKIASQAYFLSKHKKSSIYFLLLERDIRAVAYSKLTRLKEKNHILNRKSNGILWYLFSSFKVRLFNRVISDMLEHNHNSDVIRINYDELTTDPVNVLQRVQDRIGVETEDLYDKFTNNSLSSSLHYIGGSPSRKKTNEIKPDIRWKSFYENKKFASYIGSFLEKH